jgi:SPP1 gp7 family putative phage head morphogenesis protein
MDIDFEEVEETNDSEKEKEMEDKDTDFQQQKDLVKIKQGEKPEEVKASEVQETIIEEKIKGIYAKDEHIHEAGNLDMIKVNEWLDTKIDKHQNSILKAIKEDKFFDLRAENDRELDRGYLNENEINKVKSIFSVAVLNNLHIADIKNMLSSNTKIGDLYKYNKVVMPREKRIDMIAKTELTRLLNKGLIKSYEKKTDVPRELLLRWNAIIDEKTCPICHNLNNQIFAGDMITQEMFPAHPNCRCSLEEVTGHESKKTDIEEGWVTTKDGKKIFLEEDEWNGVTVERENGWNNISQDIIKKNPNNGKTFDKLKPDKDGNVILYHQTDRSSIEGIKKNGLDPSFGEGNVGDGYVYLNSNPMESDSFYSDGDVLLSVRVPLKKLSEGNDPTDMITTNIISPKDILRIVTVKGKKENLSRLIKSNPAPQELEIAIVKNGVDEEKAKRFAESYTKLTKNS